jgi:hypothetical protein
MNPSSFFSGLSRACIRDEWVGEDKAFTESVAFAVLGLACSFLTLYALSALGVFV